MDQFLFLNEESQEFLLPFLYDDGIEYTKKINEIMNDSPYTTEIHIESTQTEVITPTTTNASHQVENSQQYIELPIGIMDKGNHLQNKFIQKNNQYQSNHQETRQQSNIKWTDEQNAYICHLAEDFNRKNWKEITKIYNFHYHMQITKSKLHQHFQRVLKPGINKGKWENEEDMKLCIALLQCKPQNWTAVADIMISRSDIQVRYRCLKIRNWLLLQGIASIYLP